jgi:hypothetical protein
MGNQIEEFNWYRKLRSIFTLLGTAASTNLDYGDIDHPESKNPDSLVISLLTPTGTSRATPATICSHRLSLTAQPVNGILEVRPR